MNAIEILRNHSYEELWGSTSQSREHRAATDIVTTIFTGCLVFMLTLIFFVGLFLASF